MADKKVSSVVIKINDREVTNSFSGITKEVARLEKQLRNTVRGTDEWNQKFEEVQNAKKHLEAVRKEIGYTQKVLKDTTEAGIGFKSIFAGNIAADFFQNAAQTAMQFGTQLKERINELIEIKRNLVLIDSSLKGNSLDRAAASVKSISTTYNKGVEEIQQAVKALNAQTGDTNKSLDLIKKGFLAGADASGEMLTQLREYPTMMNDARISAEEMIAIMAQSEKLGIYDDKGIDALKEGMLRVREGTKATQDAMKALGLDVDDIYGKIKEGSLTYFDVMKLVSSRLKEIGADSRITGTAIADIFGGPGEDAGYKYLSNLNLINTNLEELTKTTDENVIAKNKELEANEKLNNVWSKLTGTASSLNRFYSGLKSGMADLLANTFKLSETKLSDEFLKQETRLRYLKTQLDNTNVSEKKKLEIFQALKTEFPQYFSGLDLEKMKHDDITKAINRSIDALGRKYKAQVFQEMYDKSSADATDKYADAMEAEKKGMELIGEAMKKYPQLQNFKFKSATTVNQLRELDDAIGKILIKERESSTIMDKAFWSQDTFLQRQIRATSVRLANANKLSSAADAQRKKDQELLDKMQKSQLPDVFTNPNNFEDAPPGSNADKNLAATPSKNDDNKIKAQIEAAEKLAREAAEKKKSAELEVYFKTWENKIAIMQDSLNKELEISAMARAKEKIQTIEENKKILQEIDDLKQKKSESTNSNEIALLDKAILDKRNLISQNNLIDLKNEETYQFKLKTIREKWKAKDFEDFVKSEQRRINEERRQDEDEINNISTMDEARFALSQMKYLKLTDQELKGIKTLEDAKRALRENADRAMLDAQLKSLEFSKKILEDSLQGITGDSAEKLKEYLEELNTKITNVKGAIAGGKEQDKSKVTEERKQELSQIDILGFSADQWRETFDNLDTTQGKLKAVSMAFQALANAGQMYSDLVRNLGEREIKNFEKSQDKKKKAELKRLNEGYINQEEYQKSIQKIEAETANKKAEIEYKQAKADKIARMFAVVGNTAMGITAALATVPPNPILAAIVGAIGAVQLGVIAAQPLPEKQSYATGGFTGSGFGTPDATGYKPAGIVHQNEWVAPEWMLQEPRTAKVIDYLESVRQGKTKPMAEGGFSDSDSVNKSQDISTNTDKNNSDFVQYIAVLMQVKDLLQKLYDEGITAEMTDSEQNGKLFKKAIKKFETIETRASGK